MEASLREKDPHSAAHIYYGQSHAEFRYDGRLRTYSGVS